MATITNVQAEINHLVEGGGETLLDRLAQRFGGMASASAVYGAPVERDGVTVIPVASIRLGFGAGNDTNQGRQGGGGGAAMSPIGYIEIRDGIVTFRRIRNLETQMLMAIPIVLAGSLNLWLIRRALRRTRRVEAPRGRRFLRR